MEKFDEFRMNQKIAEIRPCYERNEKIAIHIDFDQFRCAFQEPTYPYQYHDKRLAEPDLSMKMQRYYFYTQ